MRGSSTSVHVLLVSGPPDSAASTADKLEAHSDSVTVQIETTATDALHYLSDNDPDCIVSGYDLPDRNGIDLLETVREDYPALPVILYPDDGSEHIASTAISAGVTDYIPRQPDQETHVTLAARIADAVEPHPSPHEPDHRLDQILKTVPGCVAQLDPTGRFIYANQRAETVLGLTRSELTDRTYNDPEWNIHDLDGTPIPDENLPFRRVLDAGEPLYGLQHTVQWPDGTEKVLRVNGAPLFDDEGAIDSVVFSMTDITERRERERKLERARRIIETSTDIATIIDPDGTIRYVSPAVEDVLGYEPTELIGDNGFSYQPPEPSEAVADAIEHVLENPDETETVQTQFQHADGSSCWIESTLRNRLDDDIIEGILVSSRDLTARKKRERRYSAVFNQTYQFTGLLEPDGTVIDANETALEFADLDREEVIDNPFWEIYWWQIDEATQQQVREAIERAATGEFVRYDVEVQGADETAIIDFSIRPITDEQGTVTELLPEGRDITARKEYEQRVEEQRDSLKTLNQVVRHDIRNDLQLVTAYAEELDEQIEGGSQHRDAIETIQESGRHAVELTRTSRDMSDLLLTDEDDQTEVSLRSALEPELEEVRSRYPEAVIMPDEEIPAVGVLADEMLRSVFRNLLQNAVQHNDKPVAEVTVGVADRADTVRVCVADNGPGVSNAQKETIFGKGDKGLDSGGTGVGLYLVKTLVERYGGDVWVRDNDPEGAVFVVELRKARAER